MARTIATSAGLRAIAAYKAFKGVLALASAGAILSLLTRRVSAWLAHLADASLAHHWLANVCLHVAGASHWKIFVVSGSALAFAALDFTEAVGLYLRRAWALWLTVIASALYLPVEVVEAVRRASLASGLFFVANFAVVLYLVRRASLESAHFAANLEAERLAVAPMREAAE